MPCFVLLGKTKTYHALVKTVALALFCRDSAALADLADVSNTFPGVACATGVDAKKTNAAEKSTTRVSIHGGIRFRWRTAFFALAISGDFDGDGGSLRGGHAFGPVLILLFTAVIAFPGLHIFRLLLLPR